MESLKLHIGCMGEKIEGFKRLDIVQHGDVDYVQDAKDLSNFADGSVDEIYASHILEHFRKTESDSVLKEWARVLKKGGVMWCAVPDFDAIVKMYLKSGQLTVWLDHLIHGDQANEESIHYQCFTYPTLSYALSNAGFSRIDKVDHLPYGLADASEIKDNWFKIPISLNVKAIK